MVLVFLECAIDKQKQHSLDLSVQWRLYLKMINVLLHFSL
jgi:hypothetical protein